MTQLRLFKYSTSLLFLLNIGLILFFVMTKPEASREMSGVQFQDSAIELLKMDDDQKSLFKELAIVHNKEILGQTKVQRELLQKYFLSVIHNLDPIDNAEILKSIQQQNLNQIETTYAHFKDVKAILNEDNDQEFEVFVKEAIGKIMPKNN